MAQYLLSVWHDDDYEVDFTTPEAQRIGAQVGAFNEEVMAAGAWVFAGGLEPANTARVCRPDAGQVLVMDRPYAETKEPMGGFWAIEVPDEDTAMDWARRAAAACEGPVEVRPFQHG